jgi:hypothetical protein
MRLELHPFLNNLGCKKQCTLMINEQDSIKILNEGEYKFSHDEMLLIRELITTLAQIELDSYKQKNSEASADECDLLQKSKYRRAS